MAGTGRVLQELTAQGSPRRVGRSRRPRSRSDALPETTHDASIRAGLSWMRNHPAHRQDAGAIVRRPDRSGRVSPEKVKSPDICRSYFPVGPVPIVAPALVLRFHQKKLQTPANPHKVFGPQCSLFAHDRIASTRLPCSAPPCIWVFFCVEGAKPAGKARPAQLDTLEGAERPTSFYERPEGASLRVFHGLLGAEVKGRRWGGLWRALTKTGDYLWICPEHYAEFEPELPKLSSSASAQSDHAVNRWSAGRQRSQCRDR